MEITLNKANKLLQKLKHENDDAIYARTSIRVYSNKQNESIVEDIQKNKENLRKQYDQVCNLIIDREFLKQKIFEANVKSGLSDVLSTIDMKKKMLNLLESNLHMLRNSGFNEAEITDNLLDDMKKSSTDVVHIINLDVKFESEDELSKKVKSLRKELSQLEDKKTLLNAETKISIGFAQSTLDILGL